MAKKTKKRRRTPRMLRHSSGQARVILSGKTHYLGVYGSPEAHARYSELVTAWEANGRQPLQRALTVVEARFSVAELFVRYRAFLDQTGRYTKNGLPTRERALIEKALSELEETLGAVPVARFGEPHLLQYRDRLEANPKLTRGGINRKVSLVKRPFRWGKQRGFVPKSVWVDLQAVEPLRRTECGNRPEGRPKRVPTLGEVERVLPNCCSRQVRGMVKLQVLTGMRPGEVCGMHWRDIDTNGIKHEGHVFWIYVVSGGKTQHHGHQTRDVLNEAAQKILKEFLRPGGGFVFRPSDAMRERSGNLREKRETPITKQTRLRDSAPKRSYSDRFSTMVYHRAVQRACSAAGVERFVPHSLRHLFASWAANHVALGAGAAGVALNHAARQTTDRYVHADERLRFVVAEAAQRELRIG